jgi:hypothetical protein
MNWLSIVGAILSLTNSLIGYLRERKLIEGAVAEVLLENAKDSLEVIDRANKAREAVRADAARDPDSVMRPDEHTRKD